MLDDSSFEENCTCPENLHHYLVFNHELPHQENNLDWQELKILVPLISFKIPLDRTLLHFVFLDQLACEGGGELFGVALSQDNFEQAHDNKAFEMSTILLWRLAKMQLSLP
jgi:hypothetical protein